MWELIGSIASAFGLVFLAELGDKTQLLALGFGARYPFRTVLIGLILGFGAAGAVAAVVGGVLGAALPSRPIAIAGGILFLAVRRSTRCAGCGRAASDRRRRHAEDDHVVQGPQRDRLDRAHDRDRRARRQDAADHGDAGGPVEPVRGVDRGDRRRPSRRRRSAPSPVNVWARASSRTPCRSRRRCCSPCSACSCSCHALMPRRSAQLHARCRTPAAPRRCTARR